MKFYKNLELLLGNPDRPTRPTHEIAYKGSPFFMVWMMGLFLLFCMILSMCSQPAYAQSLRSYVVDEAGILTAAEEKVLNHHLSELQERQGVTLIVLNIKSLDGQDIKDYSIKKAREYRAGSVGQDKGGLLFVHAVHEKRIRLEVSYGLEGVITDIRSRQILDKAIIPAFRKGEYFNGIGNMISVVTSYIKEK